MSKATLLGIPDLIRGLEWMYLLVWIGLGALAVWLPPNWKSKLGATLLVLIVGCVFPVYLSLQIKQEVAKQKPIVEKRNAQLETAMARFEERCKTAGEKIYRMVDDVEGVLLTNVRPETKPSDRSDPNWPDAALPDEGRGDWYLLKFLFWEQRTKNFYGEELREDQRGFLNNEPSRLPGYRFVDVSSPDSGFQRIKLDASKNAGLISQPLRSKPARYAVAFENDVNPEDRKYWIAGTKVTVTDTETSQVIAESIWYSIEPGQGSTAGFRSPWGFARTCPSLNGQGSYATRFFVDRVLKPKKGE